MGIDTNSLLLGSDTAAENQSKQIDFDALQNLRQLIEASDLDQLNQQVQRFITQRIGFEYFFYIGRLDKTVAGTPYQLVLTNLPKTWEILYEANNYFDVDPTLSYCFKHENRFPLIWHAHLFKTFEQQRLWREMQQFGLQNGVSIPLTPVRGAEGAFSLINLKETSCTGNRAVIALSQATLLGSYVQEALSRLVFDNLIAAPDSSKFTLRELECLNWASVGKSAWEIAIVLNLSARTVRFHLDSVIKKLDAQNRPQAVAKALKMGLISGLPN